MYACRSWDGTVVENLPHDCMVESSVPGHWSILWGKVVVSCSPSGATWPSLLSCWVILWTCMPAGCIGVFLHHYRFLCILVVLLPSSTSLVPFPSSKPSGTHWYIHYYRSSIYSWLQSSLPASCFPIPVVKLLFAILVRHHMPRPRRRSGLLWCIGARWLFSCALGHILYAEWVFSCLHLDFAFLLKVFGPVRLGFSFETIPNNTHTWKKKKYIYKMLPIKSIFCVLHGYWTSLLPRCYLFFHWGNGSIVLFLDEHII